MFCRCETDSSETFNSLFKDMEEDIYVKIRLIWRTTHANVLSSKEAIEEIWF